VDYDLLSIGDPEAPESFRRAWDAWMFIPFDVKEMLTIFERPDFELAPKTAGLNEVRKMVRTTRGAFSVLISVKAWLPRRNRSSLP